MMTPEEIADLYEGNPTREQILADLDGAKLLFAEYECVDYEGQSAVLYQKEGKLYLVSAYHCSCYGLEDQWEPEEIENKHDMDMCPLYGDEYIVKWIAMEKELGVVR